MFMPPYQEILENHLKPQYPLPPPNQQENSKAGAAGSPKVIASMTSPRSVTGLESSQKMTATESNNRTHPCLSGPAATSLPTKLWVCLLADTFRRKNMTSSYREKWHQLSSLSSVNTNMQLHIRLKWSEVRPWKGAGIYHIVQLCSVITCTCYQDAVWLCSEGRAKLVTTDIAKKQNKTKPNPKTNSNSNNKAKQNKTIPSPTPQKWCCFLPCLPEILVSWVTPGRQISAK